METSTGGEWGVVSAKGLSNPLVIGRQDQVLQAEKGQMFPEDVADLEHCLI